MVATGLEWKSSSQLPDNATLAVCEGQNVTLHWQYNHLQGQHLKTEEWHFVEDGGSSDRLLAVRSQGQFVPEAGTTVQLEFMPNAGIRLVNVTVQDSGTYSVRVSFNEHGSIKTYTQTAHVHVSANGDGVVENGHLMATVRPGMTRDNRTQDLHLVLACSRINEPWRASAHIVWSTPQHVELQTSWWDDGVSYLLVPNPVTSGPYTCNLDKATAALGCQSSESPSVREGTVHMDGVEARLSLLEGKLQDVRSRESELVDKVDRLEAENSALKHQLAATGLATISFSVFILNSTHYSSDPLLLPHVISNQGEAFNVTSGQFLVPVSGLYVFHVTLTTTNPVPDSSIDTVYLMIDQHPWRSALSGRPNGYYDTGSTNMVKRLTQGQKVWLENAARGWHSLPFSVYFSGYLLRAGS
ncbi:uncharacterized protein LOC143283539 [Babylonia areolata]|uniref:uncharacterized protein LOC143283539 n=1 Tax=Babylonia areolata TaxID=304850 RepID=UPI003FD28DC4